MEGNSNERYDEYFTPVEEESTLSEEIKLMITCGVIASCINIASKVNRNKLDKEAWGNLKKKKELFKDSNPLL